MRPELQKKVDFGIKLIQAGAEMAAKVGQPIEIAYSGGKDSDCILELAKMAGVNYRAIYKNTTIDPPGTIKHAKENGVEVIMPMKNFLQLIKENGCPSRWYRFCCKTLKEYKILDYVVIGIRRVESNARAKRYFDPEKCRVFPHGEKERQYLPLLEWTNKDVEDFIKERGIKCHPLYYDEDGNFHVERRCGCLGCPLASKMVRQEELKKYPNIIKLYIRGMSVYLNEHQGTKTAQYWANPYQWLTANIFCDNSVREFKYRFGANLFNNGVDCKKFLEQYFSIEL